MSRAGGTPPPAWSTPRSGHPGPAPAVCLPGLETGLPGHSSRQPTPLTEALTLTVHYSRVDLAFNVFVAVNTVRNVSKNGGMVDHAVFITDPEAWRWASKYKGPWRSGRICLSVGLRRKEGMVKDRPDSDLLQLRPLQAGEEDPCSSWRRRRSQPRWPFVTGRRPRCRSRRSSPRSRAGSGFGGSSASLS